MTENKRFKIVDEQFISYYGGTGHQISNEECGFWLWHNKNESQKVCDKLNSILDENEKLKQQVAFLEEFLKTGVQYEYYQKVYDENEQLKQHNTELIHKIDFFERIIDGDVE